MSSTARQSAIATEIGKYHVIAELARGGMGNVYLAALCGPAGFHKLLALKELKPELADDESYVAMFLEEARLAARLVHPNIVQLNEVSSTADGHYMAMEYLDGRSLARITRRFARDGGFPVAAHLRIVADALHGLHYAHELRGFTGHPFGVVHRDVSPLNLMVTFDGQAKLLDFGIAKTDDSDNETKAGVLKGRVAYMAPEQARGDALDRRADIFAVGVILWEGVAGRRLWPQMSEIEILSRILRDEPPRLGDIVPGVPEELDAICARAMARDREDRYPTAAALLEDLEAHLARRDDRMTMRQIGEIIGVAFAEERYKMNQVIEERLAGVGAQSHSGVMPTFQRQVSGTPSHPWPLQGESGRASRQIMIAPEMGYAPAIWSETPPGTTAQEPVRAESTAASRVDGGPLTSPRSWKSGRVLVAGSLALLLLVVGVAWRLAPTALRSSSPIGVSTLPITAVEAVVAPVLPTPTTAAVVAVPAETPHVAPKPDPRETARTTPAPLKGHLIVKPPVASAAPPAAAPVEERRSPPPVNCDPPYTVDSNGIEHFKKGCL
jgi:serine/threonine protein kinase